MRHPENNETAQSSHGTSDGQAVDLLRRCGYGLLAFAAVLGIAHFLWPEYRWGQGRHSYFNLANSLTLASWLVSMQLVLIALLALVALWRERRSGRADGLVTHWIWGIGAVVALVLSLAEVTRFPRRLELLGLPSPDVYESFVIFSLWLALLLLFGGFLVWRLAASAGPGRRYAVLGLSLWILHFLLSVLNRSGLVPESSLPMAVGIWGLALLAGTTVCCGPSSSPSGASSPPLAQLAWVF